MGETPGPIPNPEAKTHSADGTAFVRMWESRTPPDNNKKQVEAPHHQVRGLPALNPTQHRRVSNRPPTGHTHLNAVPTEGRSSRCFSCMPVVVQKHGVDTGGPELRRR